ncbi:MAG: serine hydrolase domain-containing protein [Actinomycetes bacterium]
MRKAAPDRTSIAKIIDPHFDRSLQSGNAPGMAYATLVNGDIACSRGIGTLSFDEDRPPDDHTAFRIASMTKSFTAATVLSLRDGGLLDLDTPVVKWVPELAQGGPDAAVITLRHLLTMGGGFATDDPWGDRQQDLDISAFRALLARGVTPVLHPGDRFEYSNMGYAILGLVITAVTGLPYTEVVRERVLVPLGMQETGFAPGELAASSVASGYVKRSTGWQIEPLAASGAFSPMGGVLSTVNDLAKWVSYLSGHRTGAGVISEVSRREMQRTQRLVAASSATADAEQGQPPTVTGYGFGLFEELRPWGRSVFHSGGYPGFGSHMRWHSASGLAVIALANGTYAPMAPVGLAALADLVQQLDVPTVAPLPQVDGLDRAVATVRRWLAASDPDGPEGTALRALWSDNVERDLPWAERLKALESLRRERRVLREVPGSERRVEAGTVSWDLAGEDEAQTAAGRGKVRVTVMVAPHDTSLVQSLTVRPVSDRPEPATVNVS